MSDRRSHTQFTVAQLRRRYARLRELTRRMNLERRHYRQEARTFEDLTARCRNLQGHLDRHRAMIRYQNLLIDAGDRDDVFRGLFQMFVERTGTLFGAALVGQDPPDLRLVGRFGVPTPDGQNFCRSLATSVASLMAEGRDVVVLDATDQQDLFPEDIRPKLVGVNVMLIPLPSDEQAPLVGAVVLWRKGEQPFTEDDICLAEMIAASTATALRRAA
jgi:GAF domain-containing protein